MPFLARCPSSPAHFQPLILAVLTHMLAVQDSLLLYSVQPSSLAVLSQMLAQAKETVQQKIATRRDCTESRRDKATSRKKLVS